MKSVSCKGICKSFGNLSSLSDVSFSVGHGEIFGVLGPNGAGKTTLINVLTGQIESTSGMALVLGIDPMLEPVRVRANVGIVPEQENPPSFLTAIEYLYFVSKIRKISGFEKKCEWWLDFLGFSDQRDVMCKDLSRGTRQKLMIAQAFLHEPKLVFIDEPLVNLDPLVQRKVKDYLKEYAGRGNSIMISTHVLEIADELCARVAILDRGKIVASGEVAKLKKSKDESLEGVFLRLLGS